MIEIIPNWHPIFVHFTVALFSISTLLYVLSHVTSNEQLQSQWYTVARWNLWIGAAITVITVAAGWQAYNSVNHDAASHAAMTIHRNWAMGTASFFILLAIWSGVLHRAGKVRNWLFVGLMVVACGTLLSTAWLGGEAVYRFGLGVMSLPKSEGEGHDHAHADGEGHGTTSGKTAEKMKNDAHDNADGHHDKEEEKSEERHDNSDGHHDKEEKKPE